MEVGLIIMHAYGLKAHDSGDIAEPRRFSQAWFKEIRKAMAGNGGKA